LSSSWYAVGVAVPRLGDAAVAAERAGDLAGAVERGAGLDGDGGDELMRVSSAGMVAWTVAGVSRAKEGRRLSRASALAWNWVMPSPMRSTMTPSWTAGARRRAGDAVRCSVSEPAESALGAVELAHPTASPARVTSAMVLIVVLKVLWWRRVVFIVCTSRRLACVAGLGLGWGLGLPSAG
jgi:hypothetical protein